MTYISRKKAIEIVKSGGYWEQEDMEVAIACIEQTPTEDVAEVKHGEWLNIAFTQRYRCSLCGNEIYFGKDKFCSECGAKMDGGSDT